MIKAIIFDCFGVLLQDSLKLLMDEVKRADPALGQELTDILHANHRGMKSSGETYEKLAAGLGFGADELRTWLSQHETKDTRLMAYIQSLRATYKTAMLSNIGIGSLEKRFTPDELAAHFDAVVVSGEIGFAKPEPQAYEITAERLGVRLDECVFTDDRMGFCEAATSVGMQSIVYTNFAQFTKELDNLLARENS